MGTGPVTYLSSKKKAYCSLLMSPYTSIKDVSKSLLGRFSFFLTPIVYDRFRNIDMIKEAKCPIFFLHGLKDKLIPYSHSQELNNNCPTESFMHLPPDMDHNEFDFIDDLVNPFKAFVRRIEDGRKNSKKFLVSHNEESKYGEERVEEEEKAKRAGLIVNNEE